MDVVAWILLAVIIFVSGRHIARRIANGAERLAQEPYDNDYNL